MGDSSRRRRIPWRRWNNILHRDLGYLAVGMTLVYAISGLAVNHTDDWNPSFRFVREEQHFDPLPVTDRQAMARALVEVLDLPGPPKDSFRSSPHQIQLFYDGWTVEADVQAGVAIVERPRERFILRDLNRLHLNHPRGLWTWVADLYAVVLCMLAVTGMFVLKGRKGLTGRGKWLVGAGVLVPVVAVAVVRGCG
ncbi:MAG: hypothetical protein D6798_10240 [Deltaproteobacteria bacterium]|nr:MAG: hypothetical protein D6798_10240 [Deltaproteobacteria bacterium]